MGLFALGDYDPRSSDIDLIVVTDAAPGDEIVVRLDDMYAFFAASASIWASRIEAIYIPRDTLRHPTRQSVNHYPQIGKEAGVFKAPIEYGWLIQCYVMREHGIAIAAPDLCALIDPIGADDILTSAGGLSASRNVEGQDRIEITLLRIVIPSLRPKIGTLVYAPSCAG